MEAILDFFSSPKTVNVLHLSRLSEYLNKRKVTLISAAPGFGKSTAVASFLKTQKYKNCWINLDSSIDTKKKFLNIVATGIEQQFSEIWLKNSVENDSEKIKTLLKHASKHHSKNNPFCIVIDNIEKTNNNTEIQKELETLFLESREDIRFFIISRSEPAYSFRKIRAKKELLDLKNEDLTFKPEELRKLFTDIYRIFLSENEYEHLFRLTGGWIAGISFLLERLANHRKSDQQKTLALFFSNKTLPEIEDYIKQEVVDEMSQSDLELLAIMNQATKISPELIEEFGQIDGRQFLSRLENENLFIEKQEPSLYIYKFYGFFSDFLNREFFRLNPDKQKQVYIKLSDYYEMSDKPQLAINFFLKAGNLSKAYSYLAEYAEEMLQTGEYENIRVLLSYFPKELIENDLQLSYYNAISNSILHPEESQETLMKLLPKIQKNKNYDMEAMAYTVLLTSSFFYQRNRSFIIGIAEKASTFLQKHSGNIDIKRKELLTTLLPLGNWWISPVKQEVFEAALRAEEISHRFHNKEAFLCARLVLCRIYLEKGDFKEASRLLNKTENLMKKEERYANLKYYRTLLSYYKGDALFYMGEIIEAISEIQKGLSFAPRDFSFLPYLQLNLILYNLYLDNIEHAETLYNDIRDDDLGDNLYLHFNFDFFFKLVIAYRNGNVRRTDYFCRRLLDSENEDLLKSDYPYTVLTLTEVLIYLEDYNEADVLITRIKNELSCEFYPYTIATAIGLKALLESRKGNRKEAKKIAAEMSGMLEKNDRRNIEICDPAILKEINELTDGSRLSQSPRLLLRDDIIHTKKHSTPLEIYTLGQFRVFIEGTEISSTLLSSQKRVMDLLKFLIVFRKNGVMKERIYEIFWPNYSYKSTRDNLNTIIYRLRKMLGDSNEYLLTDVNSIQFNPEITFIDIDRFQDYLLKAQNAENSGKRDSAVKLYRECISSYTGDFLKGDLYHDFIRDERENLQSKYRTALFKLVHLSLQMEEYVDAMEWAKRLMESDPLCEASYRLLMICSAYIGSRSEIPRLYDKLNKKLQTYYKIQADEKTLALKEKLMTGSLPSCSDWQSETII